MGKLGGQWVHIGAQLDEGVPDGSKGITRWFIEPTYTERIPEGGLEGTTSLARFELTNK